LQCSGEKGRENKENEEIGSHLKKGVSSQGGKKKGVYNKPAYEYQINWRQSVEEGVSSPRKGGREHKGKKRKKTAKGVGTGSDGNG